jgi:hypothetical protein
MGGQDGGKGFVQSLVAVVVAASRATEHVESGQLREQAIESAFPEEWRQNCGCFRGCAA